MKFTSYPYLGRPDDAVEDIVADAMSYRVGIFRAFSIAQTERDRHHESTREWWVANTICEALAECRGLGLEMTEDGE